MTENEYYDDIAKTCYVHIDRRQQSQETIVGKRLVSSQLTVIRFDKENVIDIIDDVYPCLRYTRRLNDGAVMVSIKEGTADDDQEFKIIGRLA